MRTAFRIRWHLSNVVVSEDPTQLRANPILRAKHWRSFEHDILIGVDGKVSSHLLKYNNSGQTAAHVVLLSGPIHVPSKSQLPYSVSFTCPFSASP